MSIRISNILNTAIGAIGGGRVEYRLYSGRSISDIGVPSVSYTEWNSTRAFVHPGIVSSFGGSGISEKEYKDLGFSWSRENITVWISNVGLHTSGDENAADQIRLHGKVYNVLQVEDWIEQNGWKRCYCVLRRENDGE